MTRCRMLSHVRERRDHELLAGNARYADRFDKADLTAPPRRAGSRRHVQDTRIHTHEALGVLEGDIHVIRNAGGVVTDDTIRSLAISQRLLGTTAVDGRAAHRAAG